MTTAEYHRRTADLARRLASAYPEVVAVALVGSHARSTARSDSDVDLVVLTGDPAALLDSDAWWPLVDPGCVLVAARDFGAIQERRLRAPDGTDWEFGIGTPGWARTDPVDPGTRRVVADGLVPLHDQHGLLARLVAAVTR